MRNDTLAVRLYPSVLLLADGPDQLSREGLGNWWDYNPDYASTIDGTAPAAPHLEGGGPNLIVPEERWWDLLAISAALRDRHFPTAIRAAATPVPPRVEVYAAAPTPTQTNTDRKTTRSR